MCLRIASGGAPRVRPSPTPPGPASVVPTSQPRRHHIFRIFYYVLAHTILLCRPCMCVPSSVSTHTRERACRLHIYRVCRSWTREFFKTIHHSVRPVRSAAYPTRGVVLRLRFSDDEFSRISVRLRIARGRIVTTEGRQRWVFSVGQKQRNKKNYVRRPSEIFLLSRRRVRHARFTKEMSSRRRHYRRALVMSCSRAYVFFLRTIALRSA